MDAIVILLDVRLKSLVFQVQVKSLQGTDKANFIFILLNWLLSLT